MFNDVIDKLENFKRAQRAAALTVFAIHKPRIFEEGRNSKGGKIGKYVSGSKDKRGDKRGGKDVILSFTEAMKKDYQPSAADANVVGYGFSNQVELDKANWNEERYNQAPIFLLTNRETDLYLTTLSDLIFGKK